MKGGILKKITSVGLLIFLSFFVFTSVSAFSLNPVSFFGRTSDIIARRVSDIVHYLIMQKRYIFDNYSDPNIYPASDSAVNLEKISNLISTSTPEVIKNIPTTPIPVNTSTVSSIKQLNPEPVDSASGKTVKEVPVLIVKSNIIQKDDDKKDPDPNPSLILKLTNEERKAESLKALTPNLELDKIAGLRADDLFANQYFEHESPVGNNAPNLAKKVGYDYLLIGENLALGDFTSEQEIVSAWMKSEGHRANILNSKFSELGVAMKEGVFKGENMLIAVQVFAEPLSNCHRPDKKTKETIDTSSADIKKMQSEALLMYNNLNSLKNIPGVDRSFYNQKIQEYNYFAKKINDAVANLKIIIDTYNASVAKYNSCIKN